MPGLAFFVPRLFPVLAQPKSDNRRSDLVDCSSDGGSRGVGVSEADLLRARAKRFQAWAIKASEETHSDYAEYLTALARECLGDAAALDAMQGRSRPRQPE